MFWVRIRLGGREYLGVLDTGATISIVAKRNLPCGDLKNILPTAAIRMGDEHVVHSCGDFCSAHPRVTPGVLGETVVGTVRWKRLWVLEVLPIDST